MAFLKYARAKVVHPVFSSSDWNDLTKKPSVKVASSVVQKFDPNEYLLTHCTIMASVDTEKGPGVLGSSLEDQFQVNRLYPDYYITSETSEYINNNYDSWERKLLLATFPTFVGGYNFVEHLQVPELSKGRVIDAVARDIGPSLYIDILVATERKHQPLIQAIESQQMNTLSMGCSVTHTICSKCGNVAEDETQMCKHIKYMKGNTFIDGLGKVRKVAELCGHISDPKSVKFIEASWVANPAFKGAVVRNILSPVEEQLLTSRKGYELPSEPEIPTVDISKMAFGQRNVVKYTNYPTHSKFKVSQDFGEQSEGSSKSKEEGPFQKAVTDVVDSIKEKAIEKVREELAEGENPVPKGLVENRNDNLIRQAYRDPYWRNVGRMLLAKYKDVEATKDILYGLILLDNGGWSRIGKVKYFSGSQVLEISSCFDELSGVRTAGDGRVLRTVIKVGGTTPYRDSDSYLAACRRIFGRDLTNSERDNLLVKGRLYDLGIS